MLANPALPDLGVLDGDTAKGDEQLSVLDDRWPAGLLINKLAKMPEDMGKNHLGGGETVGID